jgi:sec-independent protein translocase protein TatC
MRSLTIARMGADLSVRLLRLLAGNPPLRLRPESTVGYTSQVAKNSTKTMPIMGHLGELRKRLTYVALVVVACCIACFVEWHRLYGVLMHPLHMYTHVDKLAVLGVTEGFMTILKVSIYAGLIVSTPFILYQFWAFIMPALYENEKRSVLPYVAATSALFLGGVTFSYFLVLPVGLRFLVNYGGNTFNMLLQADRYLSFVSLFVLAFGVVFELPLIMMLLAWIGLIDYKRMRKYRKYAILVEAVIAMVFTPSQDPVSMMLMLIPLIVLYEVGIWLSRMVAKRKAKRRELAAAAETEGMEAKPV